MPICKQYNSLVSSAYLLYVSFAGLDVGLGLDAAGRDFNTGTVSVRSVYVGGSDCWWKDGRQVVRP